MLHNDEIIRNINFEIEQISKELVAFTPLMKMTAIKTPDLIESTALSSVLHSFYTGIEKIFSIIAKKIYNNFPTGYNWHKELLRTMSSDKENRVISDDLYGKLLKYLAFRHFFRNSYDFQIDWKEMKDLVSEIPDIWEQTKKELVIYLAKNK